MNRIVLTLLVSIVLSGCASKTIQVVDREGKPVKGALVISEQQFYLSQSWMLGVQITDDQGEAVVVNDRGHIFKPGYFPVIDGSELSDGVLWHAQSFFSKRTPIYPIQTGEQIDISASTYNTVNPIESGIYIIPLSVCTSKVVSYNANNFRLKVRSSETDIIVSERFYFEGADDLKRVSAAERENGIAFYCREDDNLYKVGVYVSEKAWSKGVPDHKLAVFFAKVPTTESYLQPEIKCINSESLKIITSGKYRDVKPDLYVSADVKNKLSSMKRQVPCSNEFTDELFKYLEQALENG